MTARWLLLLAAYAAVLWGGLALSSVLPDLLGLHPDDPSVKGMIASLAVLYVVTSALPFVPGAEIGFGLIMTFGREVAVLVYLCMVFALTAAFLAGRLIPFVWLKSGFLHLGMRRAASLVDDVAAIPPGRRADALIERASGRAIPALLRYRHVAFALALNLPGNALLGGGGGLALLAGMSGLFTIPGFFAAVLVAVAPVPLFFLLAG